MKKKSKINHINDFGIYNHIWAGIFDKKSKFSDWYQIITSLINYLPQTKKSIANEIMRVLMRVKDVTLNNNFTMTKLKSGMKYEPSIFFRQSICYESYN